MTEDEKEVLLAYAEHNMDAVKAGKSIYYHPNTLGYRMTKIQKKYGLNPRRFYDLVELLKIAKGG